MEGGKRRNGKRAEGLKDFQAHHFLFLRKIILAPRWGGWGQKGALSGKVELGYLPLKTAAKPETWCTLSFDLTYAIAGTTYAQQLFFFMKWVCKP